MRLTVRGNAQFEKAVSSVMKTQTLLMFRTQMVKIASGRCKKVKW